MRCNLAVLVLHGLFILIANCADGATDLRFEHTSSDGTLTIRMESPHQLQVLATPRAPDILYPEGAQLARMEHASGAIITLSFDHARTFTPAQQKAFYEVVGEAADKDSPRHHVDPHKDRRWTLQSFHSPQETIITAQTFVESHALGFVFWLPTPEFSTVSSDDFVFSMLNTVHVQWIK